MPADGTSAAARNRTSARPAAALQSRLHQIAVGAEGPDGSGWRLASSGNGAPSRQQLRESGHTFLLRCMGPEGARSGGVLPRSKLVAFGAERT
jgi:hypothetical protein